MSRALRVYNFHALERLLQPQSRLEDRLGINGKTLSEYRRNRWLTWQQADRLAVRAGYSPYDIWGIEFGDETAALFSRLAIELQEALCTSAS